MNFGKQIESQCLLIWDMYVFESTLIINTDCNYLAKIVNTL